MKYPINNLSPPNVLIRPMNALEQELLAESLREPSGLLQPLTVCRHGEFPIIIDGYRRWLVCKAEGWAEIDIHEVQSDDPDRLRTIIQTRQTTFGKTEKRVVLAQYFEQAHQLATAGDVAHYFKWPVAEVEQLCCIPWLCPELRDRYHAGEIPLYTAWFLGRLKDGYQLEIMQEGHEVMDMQEAVEAKLREVKHARRRATTSRRSPKSFNKIQSEIERPVFMGEILIAADAKTAADGYLAALAWAIESK